MPQPKVHHRVMYRMGSDYTLCSRINPQHSTTSVDWVTCRTCISRLDLLFGLSREQGKQAVREWVEKARKKNQQGGLAVLT